jgi:hypothetical protein
MTNAVRQPHPSVSQKMETRKAGIAISRSARFMFYILLSSASLPANTFYSCEITRSLLTITAKGDMSPLLHLIPRP